MSIIKSSGNTEVLALADLISSAAQDLIQEYLKDGNVLPSLNSTVAGPYDNPDQLSPALLKAIRTIEAACAQLSCTVASPGHIIVNKVFQYEEPACMLVVQEAKIADLLLDKPEGLHVDELANKTSLDTDKLKRILRILATKHCFREVKTDVFANNRLSLQLVSTNPVSSLVGHLVDEGFRSAVHLNEILKDPKTALSTSINDTAFHRAHGSTPFEYWGSPAGAKAEARFSQALVGWGSVTGKSFLPKVYDWDKVPEDTVICDVGGNNGHVTLNLMKQFPKIKVVVQDLPTVIPQAEELWSKEYQEAVEKQRVEFIPIDFLKESPALDCEFYYLRHILHDWPDHDCLKILGNIRKAMGPTSRLLVHEYALQDAARADNLLNQAPEPLLPNYGIGRIRQYNADINMMVFFHSKERTMQEFIDLAKESGMQFEAYLDAGETAIMEFSPA